MPIFDVKTTLSVMRQLKISSTNSGQLRHASCTEHELWKGPILQARGSQWNPNWDMMGQDVAMFGSRTPLKQIYRRLFLVRHGQCQDREPSDEHRVLTPLGRRQATATGKRLAYLGIVFDSMVYSTMARATETANLILSEITETSPEMCVYGSSLIRDSDPILAEPPFQGGFFLHPESDLVAGPIVESGFRALFHRPPPSQDRSSNHLVVCHANVIRYLTMRALQLNPRAWSRFAVNHCSITLLTVAANGRVHLVSLGERSHFTCDLLSA